MSMSMHLCCIALARNIGTILIESEPCQSKVWNYCPINERIREFVLALGCFDMWALLLIHEHTDLTCWQFFTSWQVLIQYDLQKSNAELALDYGFIESRSDRDAYTLTLEIPESDPFFGDKLDIAESNGLGETAYFDIVLGRALPPAMLPFLRLVALGGTDAFLLESIFRNSIWGHLEFPVSRANEEFICRVVRDACSSALSGYHTTDEEVVFLLCCSKP